MTTYEACAKWRIAGGSARAQVALFYNDYRDYLAGLLNPTVNGVQVNDTVLLNAGHAGTYGLDLDITARLGEHLDWSGSIEVLRSRFEQFLSPASGVNYVGNELPNAPRISGSSSIRFNAPAGETGQVSLSGTIQYLGAQFSDVANSSALRLKAQTYVHVSAAFTTLSTRPWTVSLVIRNAFNRTQVILRQIVPPLGVDAGAYNLPRSMVLSVRHDF